MEALKVGKRVAGWNRENILTFIESLDERLIKKLLMEMYRERYEKDTDR